MHCFPHTHIYVSVLGYLVPHHHLPIQLPLLHVHLRLHARVFLCGKRKEKVYAEMWVNIFSMTTTDRASFSIYQGSGAETTVGSGQETPKWLCLVIALFLVPTHLLISAYHTAMESWAGPGNKTTGFVSNSVTSDILVCATM